MRKFLTFFLTALLAFGVGWAVETVTLDFTTNDWGLPVGSPNSEHGTNDYTNGTYTVTFYAPSSGGYYFNSVGYTLLGKTGATLTFPTFDKKVLKIEVVGREGASPAVLQNIYVGNNEASEETTGATGKNYYMIKSQYQEIGTVYTLKINSKHNTQITSVIFYLEESEEPPVNTPWLTFTPEELTIGEAGGSLYVNGDHLGSNPGVWRDDNGYSNQFDWALQGVPTGQTWFPANNGAVTDAEVAVSYNGRELTAQGKFGVNSNNTGDGAFAIVTYQPDIYIEYNKGNGWDHSEGTKMDYDNGVYTKTVTITNPGTYILFARKLGVNYNWDTNRLFFGAKTDNEENSWWYVEDKTDNLNLYPSAKYSPIYFQNAGAYTITINAEDKTFTVISAGVNTIAEAQDFEDGTFTYMGSARATYQHGQNLWIRDSQGNSGLIYGNVDTFANGDSLAIGWTAQNEMYNYVIPRFKNPSGVTNAGNKGPVAPYTLSTIELTDMNKYASMSNVTITRVDDRNYYFEVNSQEYCLRDNYNLVEDLVKDHIYNVVGVVSAYNGVAQLNLISVEDITPMYVTLESETTTATAGNEIPVTVNVVNAVGDYTISYKIGESGTPTTLTDGNVINVTSETAGEVTLYVTVTSNDNEATAQKTFTFTEPVQPGSNVFKLLTDYSQLQEGKRVIIANKKVAGNNETYAMGAQQTSNFKGTPVSISNDLTIEATEETQILTLEGETGAWYFKAENNEYLYAASSSANQLKTQATKTDNAKATIVIGEAGNTQITFQGDHSRNRLRFNEGSTLFSCYSTGQLDIYLYVETASTPEPDPMTISLTEAPEEAYTVGDNVTVTATVENGSENTVVTYKINNGDEQTYTDGIVLPNTAAGDVVVTVKATDGNKEATDTVTYHFNAAEAFEISLNADPNEETYTVGETVNVKVAVENALGDNLTITYTLAGNNREGVEYPAEGIDITRKTAGDVTLTVNVTDGYDHEGASSKEATYTFVAANAIQVELDPAEKTYTIGDEAKVKVTITGTIGEYETAILINGEETEITIDENGYITLPNDKAGNVTLTVTVTDGYAHAEGGTATGTYTFNKKPAGLSFNDAEYTKYVGDLSFEGQEVNNPNELTVKYVASNDLVEIDENDGTVLIGDEPGDVTIYAISAETETFLPDTVSYVITIKAKEIATLSFDIDSITVYPNAEDFVQPKLTTNPEGLTVEYESSDDAIATVIEGVLVIGEKEGTATITAKFKGNTEYGEASASYTVTVEPRPIIVADDGVEFELYVGETASKTFVVAGANLKGDITLTLTDETGFFSIDPVTIAKPAEGAKAGEVNATVTVTYAPEAEGVHSATVTLSTPDALETVTVSLTGLADVRPVVATPTFSLVSGSYTGPQTVTIDCATEGATIRYTVNGETTEAAAPVTVNLNADATIEAVAIKDGCTTSEKATAYYIVDVPEEKPTMDPFDGYFKVMNNGNQKFVNVAGRKTITFANEADIDKMAGTVIYLKTDNHGQVQSLRSQAADLQGYADRAMRYVPEFVELIVNKLHAEGAGNILGETGYEAIMNKFNESFDHHLYVEAANGGYRLYGKTPSMQPVVDFYRENQNKVEAKLPQLEEFINDAIQKVLEKTNGSGASILQPFSLHETWERMGGNLTEPVDAESTMAFYRQVLNDKNNVWSFAYETAMTYWERVKNHPRYDELQDMLGDFAQYIDKVEQVRPDFKYYIVADGNKIDYISQGNKDVDADRSIWTLTARDNFKVNFSLTADNKSYYTTLYTDFAYDLPEEGITAYKVIDVTDRGYTVAQPVTGTIPAQTPIMLKANAAGDFELTLKSAGSADMSGNILVGADYFINEFELKTEQLVTLFNLAKDILGESFYNNYVSEYEHLMALNAGTVHNKYMWGLSQTQVEACVDNKDCVIRSLDNGDNGLGYYENWEAPANRAFLESTTFNPILITVKGDVDRDGDWDISDVTATISFALGENLNDPVHYDYDAADTNDDGVIDVTDVTGVISIVLADPAQQTQDEGGN